MRAWAFVILLAVSAQAQSVIYQIGPIPKTKVKHTVVSDSTALAAMKHADSTFLLLDIDNGDVTGDGRVSNADIIFLKNYVLLKGPAPKAHMALEYFETPVGKDSVMINVIVSDSVGVKVP